MNADEIMRLADEYRLASDWRYEAMREALAAAVRKVCEERDDFSAKMYRSNHDLHNAWKRAEKAEQEVARLRDNAKAEIDAAMRGHATSRNRQ